MKSNGSQILVVCIATACCQLFAQEAGQDETAGAAKRRGSLSFVSLQAKTNHQLKESLNPDGKDNSFKGLPQGGQEFCGIRFQVGPGFIRLGGKQRTTLPRTMDAIVVGSVCHKLHFLQGTEFGAFGGEGHPFFVRDGTSVGHYVVHYADGSTGEIPIVYGEDVRDWWNWDKSKGVTRGKVAWTGKSENADEYNVTTRLYVTTWVNPKPDVKLDRIDFASAFETAASPFCIAITAEK